MQVAVIGAGVGGMCAAIRLAKAGHSVTVFEQGERVGGKLNLWHPDVPGVGGFRFDTGPHVLTMPWAIRELFDDLGERMEDHLNLVRMDPICRYHFADEMIFDAPADPREAEKRVAEQFPGDEVGFRDLLRYARRVHEVTVDPFLRQDFANAIRGAPTPKQWGQLFRFLGLKPWETVRQRVHRHLRAPKLRQLFELYAFYNGSSPAHASAIFTIIAHVQWGDGTYYLRGGLRAYADALTALAEKFGVDVRLGWQVAEIVVGDSRARDHMRIMGIRVEGESKTTPADIVVCNADPLTAYATLIHERSRPAGFTRTAIEKREPSTSAFLLLLGIRGAYGHLAHYNSFLPEDGDAEYEAIFERKEPAADPVIGVTCQSVTEPGCAPEGFSNLFIMTSPPALGSGFEWTPENTAQYRERILDQLEMRCGMTGLRDRIVCEQMWTPVTFADRYGAWRGSLYGTSSNGWRSAFLRPPIRGKNLRGLYFVGGGTHPGGGLPLVTLSGKIVADAVVSDMPGKNKA